MGTAEPIAIIGMAGRFPNADTIAEFWTNLTAGRDCLTELDDEELLRYHEDPELISRPDYVRKRPVLADSDAFDAQLFGMTPREAELRDPQYRLMLETVHASLEHAGYAPDSYPGQIGLFAGTNVNRYRYDYIEKRRDVVNSIGFLTIDVANHPDYLCTYIAYKLGLRGPSVTVLTACSTSLMAVHLACASIRAGDCDMAVAGGVDIEFPYHRGYVHLGGGISARDGTPRAFDAEASGTNFGDGVGAVVLKPLKAALADGDTVHATVLGSAINNDGNRKVGFTAPSVEGQSECIGRALRAAGVSPREIDYLEAHGTATVVGDPIELTALIEAYRQVSSEPLPPQYCPVGSVKSNIGHLGQAAGIAALIKTTLAMTQRLIPPSINMATPNPGVDWSTSPFYVNTTLREWPATEGRPRRAGVSSFGIGGTNAHLILEEAPPRPARGPRPENQVLLWSAMDDHAERMLRERLAAYFGTLDDATFPDAAHTLRVGRTVRPVRGAVLATGAADAAAALSDTSRIISADGRDRATVFAFPGQGGLHPYACRQLYDDEPVFRTGCDAALEILHPLLGLDLRALWLRCADPAELADTRVAQPLLYVLEYTLAHCLQYWGVQPAMLIGHSLGELVAAAVAGVFDFESGLRAVAARAQCMAMMPLGKMIAAACDRDAVADLLDENLALAVINGKRQVVLSGPVDAVDSATGTLKARGVEVRPLATSHAFHSPMMSGAVPGFGEALAGMTLHPPAVPVISALTGAEVTGEQAVSPEFWTRPLTEPVDFDRAVRAVLAQGPATVVEAGPGQTLTGLLRTRADVRGSESRVLPAAPREGRSAAVLDETLAKLWVDGVPVTYWRQVPAGAYQRVAVPGYPYQRRRYWLDLPDKPARTKRPDGSSPTAPPERQPAPTSHAAQAGPAPGEANVTAGGNRRWELAEVEWVPELQHSGGPELVAAPFGAAVLLVPDEPALAQALRSAVQRAGYRTVVAGERPGAGAVTIDPARPEDWLALLEKVGETSPGRVLIGHAALPGRAAPAAPDAQLAAGFAALQGALRAAAVYQRKHRVPAHVLLIGREIADVTGAEPVNPAASALLALLRSAEQELPGLRCQAVDIADRVADDLLYRVIAEPDSPLVALRGRHCWRPRLRELPEIAGRSLLRPRGTYLITGGLGGIGMVVAQALAETGLSPRLALLTRSGLTGLAEPARTQAQAQVAALGEAGAEVEAYACDVGDARALAEVIDRLEDTFGPVNGVVHGAGVADGGLLERRGADEIRAVLHPKVSGLLALEETFARRPPLDFLVLFSSHAGLSGLYGSAGYAAANAFLDAYARLHATGQRRTVSLQWPGWAEVGMLARSDSAQAVLAAGARQARPAPAPGTAAASRTTTATPAASDDHELVTLQVLRAPNRDWEFDEHLFDGVPVLPGTALVEFAVMAAGKAGIAAGAAALELRGTTFLAPVVGDRPHEVRVLCTPIAGVHRFRVQARAAGSGEPWTDHATGTAGPTDPIQPEGLAELTARLPARTSSGLAGWMSFGGRWATITETRGGDTERLARLVLPERYHGDLADHPAHPAILDVAAGVLTDLAPGRQYAPFMYRRLVLLGPLTADVTVHSRFTASDRHPRPVDFDIYDSTSGMLLARAESFAMREVTAGGLGGPRAASQSASGQQRADGLLLPRDGAAAFLDLMRTETPPVVLVGVPGARIDVPGMPWEGAAPQPAPPVAVSAAPVAAETATAARPDIQGPGDDPVTDGLRSLWVDALGVTEIDVNDDFFELGGNSLTAVQLASRVSTHFGIELAAGTMFEASTLRTLAEEVRLLRGQLSPDGAT